MRSLRLLGMVCLTVGVCGFTCTAAALAEELPELLPNPTKTQPLGFKGEGGNLTLETAKGTKFQCTGYTDEGTITSVRSGTAHIDFKGCRTGKTGCSTSGDAAETVLDEGAINLVTFLRSNILTLGIEANLSESANLAINCGVLLVLLKGAIIAEVTNGKELEKIKSGEGVLRQAKGSQEIKECDHPVEVCFEENKFKEKIHKKFLLQIELGKGFEEAGLEMTGKVTLAKEVELHF